MIGFGQSGISIIPDSEFAPLVRFGPRRAFRANRNLRRSDSFELGDTGLADDLVFLADYRAWFRAGS